MTEELTKAGIYIYCVIDAPTARNFDCAGIGGNGDEVYTLCHKGIAAVVSNSPLMKYPITRKHTIAHQKVLEEAMKSNTVLPVRFSTIAEGKDGVSPEERITEKVLAERRQEFEHVFRTMKDKVELGIKAIWRDMDAVFQDIVLQNRRIEKLREQLRSKSSHAGQRDKVRLGEMVKEALGVKRAKLAGEIVAFLRTCSCDSRANKTFGDSMIVNSAFLVEKSRIPDFDARVNQLSERFGEEIKLKYVGPVPPCNFVEVVIHWEN